MHELSVHGGKEGHPFEERAADPMASALDAVSSGCTVDPNIDTWCMDGRLAKQASQLSVKVD